MHSSQTSVLPIAVDRHTNLFHQIHPVVCSAFVDKRPIKKVTVISDVDKRTGLSNMLQEMGGNGVLDRPLRRPVFRDSVETRELLTKMARLPQKSDEATLIRRFH